MHVEVAGPGLVGYSSERQILSQYSIVVLRDVQIKDYEARTLLLPNQTIEALLAWQPEAPEGVPFILLTARPWRTVRERWLLCRAGKPWQRVAETGELVWGEWENRYMANNVIRDMRRHVGRAGLELTAPLTVHTLRKSFAQNHADTGTHSMTLETLMGHASITTMEKFYLQQSDDNQRAALRRYENLLARESCVKLAYEPSEGPEHPTSQGPANPQTRAAKPLR